MLFVFDNKNTKAPVSDRGGAIHHGNGPALKILADS
jgi:hypothetical protein